MAVVVPPVNDGKADSKDYEGSVITAYNGAADSMPQTFRRLKGVFKDDGREIVNVDDPEATADFVITVVRTPRAAVGRRSRPAPGRAFGVSM
jgi:hypothetical protein